MTVSKPVCFSLAQYDPNEDPNVVRAKYFIRGEFLVSKLELLIVLYGIHIEVSWKKET